MNKRLIAATSAVVLAFAATAAHAQVVGHVDGAYGNSNDADSDTWTLSGGVAIPAGPVTIELDAQGSTTHIDGFGNEKGFGATGHVYYRNDKYAVGGFVSGADEGVSAWGGEGALYLSQVTLSAQIAQLHVAEVGNVGTTYSVGGKFFATDNLAFGADYVNLNPKGFGSSVDVWDLTGEYMFSAAPVSAFVAYQRIDDFDADAWSIGARWHFGAKTLKEQDRKGASMGGLSVLGLF